MSGETSREFLWIIKVFFFLRKLFCFGTFSASPESVLNKMRKLRRATLKFPYSEIRCYGFYGKVDDHEFLGVVTRDGNQNFAKLGVQFLWRKHSGTLGVFCADVLCWFSVSESFASINYEQMVMYVANGLIKISATNYNFVSHFKILLEAMVVSVYLRLKLFSTKC